MVEKKETTEVHGVIFALVRDGKICLEKRTDPRINFYGYTIIPGGRIETGETQEEALLREVQEEYGVKALSYQNIGIVDSNEGNILNFRHIFLVTDWEGRLSNPEKKNKHLTVTLEKARVVCTHPISVKILEKIDKALS